MTGRQRLIQWMSRVLEPVGNKIGFRLYGIPFNSFYWSIPSKADLNENLWSRRSQLAGIDLSLSSQLELVERLAKSYASELHAIDTRKTAYGLIDAQLLHGILRHRKPKRMIEIGGGTSTRIALNALRLNERETGEKTEFQTIEPYPSRDLLSHLPEPMLIRRKVQDVPLEMFQSLQSGDVLFIDSSHVLHIGSDVQYEFLEIIPRLAAGVAVHVHDIFLPYEYHRYWVMEGRFWDEQYLLQAFLQFNTSWKIMASTHLLWRDYLDAIAGLVAPGIDLTSVHPSSFWMERLG